MHVGRGGRGWVHVWWGKRDPGGMGRSRMPSMVVEAGQVESRGSQDTTCFGGKELLEDLNWNACVLLIYYYVP